MKSKSVKRKQSIKIIFTTGFFLIAFLFFFTCEAFSMNADYLDESKWNSNSNITTVSINKKSMANTLNGVFKYYIDNNNRCIYTYFSVKESSISADFQDIRVNFSIRTYDESYQFSVDKNGICDALDEESEIFQVYQNYKTYSNSKSGLYICAIQFNDNNTENLIDISFYANGHKYIISENLIMPVPDITTKQTTVSEAAGTTGKSSASSKSTEKKTEKSTTESTKYIPPKTNYSSSAENAIKKYSESSASDNYNAETMQNSQGEAVQQQESNQTVYMKLSKPAMILLIIAGITALTGVIFLLSAFFGRNKNKESNTDNSKENDEGS